MPMAGTPMIDYTIRFLRYNGVKEIFVFSAQNKKMVEEYFKKLSGPKIKVVSSEQCKR
jgi:NDP-sugar pyrophosphorylase family protein